MLSEDDKLIMLDLIAQVTNREVDFLEAGGFRVARGHVSLPHGANAIVVEMNPHRLNLEPEDHD